MTPLQGEIMRFVLALHENEKISVPLLIDALLHCTGHLMAGAAKPGREPLLIATAIGALRNYVDDAHALADEKGLHFDGRQH
jgi:thiazole synthase ThiGH ThiG subunit